MSVRTRNPDVRKIPVLLDIEEQLQRQLLGNLLEQQSDLELIKFNPSDSTHGPEIHVCTDLANQLDHRCDLDVVVVITTVERYGKEQFAGVYRRWLHEFPELFVIALSWTESTIRTYRQKIIENEFVNQIDNLLAAIREIAS